MRPAREPGRPDPCIDVAAAVIVREGQVLLARRVGGYLDRMWEFPGGKMEGEESAQQAVEREILEELHLRVSAGKQLLILEHEYPDKRIRLHFVHCRLLPVPPTGTPAHESGWFAVDRFPWAEFCPADQVAARHLPWPEIL